MRDLVFVSDSHKGAHWLRRLRVFLKPYERKGLQVWADDHIQVGDRWERKIHGALPRTRVGVLLTSASFLASDSSTVSKLPAFKKAAAGNALRLFCVPVGAASPRLLSRQ